MICPNCKVPLKPFYNKNATKPSFYYCQEMLSAYANTPHYKYFYEDDYGYEVFMIWNNGKRGNLYTVKRTIENNKIIKIEITYNIQQSDSGYYSSHKTITRTFKPDEFEFDESDWESLTAKVEKIVQISEIFS